jgi:uncharacterized protein (DUF2235 family)
MDGSLDSSDRAMDKICIFGFSRGAYTARALAGMIHKVCVCEHNYSTISQLELRRR